MRNLEHNLKHLMNIFYVRIKEELTMSTNKLDIGDLFLEAFMETLAEEAAPPKKESNKHFSNKTIQSPAEFESCKFESCKFKGSTYNPSNKSNYRFHNCCFDNCSFED
jgi:uncharacterized protein YjbI with pentapeptide repeats